MMMSFSITGHSQSCSYSDVKGSYSQYSGNCWKERGWEEND